MQRVDTESSQAEDEIEIDHLVLELGEDDDPAAGQAIAQRLLSRLGELLES